MVYGLTVTFITVIKAKTQHVEKFEITNYKSLTANTIEVQKS